MSADEMETGMTDGLERIRKQALEKDEAKKSLNKLRFNINQQCDRVSMEASNVSSQIKDVQDKINKNVITVNQELAAFKKATEAENRMEDRDRKIESDFNRKVQFIEECQEEIARLQHELEEYDTIIQGKEKEAVGKLNSLRKINKLLCEYSGIYWDFDNCSTAKLSGYVKCKALSRIRPFELSLANDQLQIARELWSMIDELNTQ